MEPKLFIEQLEQFAESDYSDVTLIVDGYRIPAHRIILAARSDYFRELLFDGKMYNHTDIILSVDLTVFLRVLKYIYTGHLPLSEMELDLVVSTLHLARTFDLVDLMSDILKYLIELLPVINVCEVLNDVRMNASKDVMVTTLCLSVMDRKAADILQHETFRNLSLDAINSLLSRDSFFAREIDIFKAVHNWYQENMKSVKNVSDLLSNIRFSLMSQADLLSVVLDSGMLDSNQILDIMKNRVSGVELPFRGKLSLGNNLASYSPTLMVESNSKAKVYDLGDPHYVNCIILTVPNSCDLDATFIIEVSVDKTHWKNDFENSKTITHLCGYVYKLIYRFLADPRLPFFNNLLYNLELLLEMCNTFLMICGYHLQMNMYEQILS
ncbi:BTB/POZ domain-containing protein 9-like [Anopheles nili]|uniref:BTB/POZ domain-containing protein 9-like n=1 Tax=Anopheles nili TaxID=185578 RepID=UPI00237AD32E|nr:BTB/POZ domain-containing protein 9-like [Anopheles nili]